MKEYYEVSQMGILPSKTFVCKLSNKLNKQPSSKFLS